MRNFILFTLAALAAWSIATGTARAENRVGDVCRVKGQEENTLQGTGLVIGLRGTGDGDSKVTQRAYAQFLELTGMKVGVAKDGTPNLEELKNFKNVALVHVTATIPAGGASPGDQVECTVSAPGAKSLEGGTLVMTALMSPNLRDKRVYATAQGLLSLDDGISPQVARVNRGATVEREFKNEFVKNNKITLLLKPEFNSFEFSQMVSDAINGQQDLSKEPSDKSEKTRSTDYYDSPNKKGYAKAMGADRVEIEIPATYAESPEYLVDVILQTKLPEIRSGSTVIINKRQRSVIIGEDVEIAPVAVMHKNRVIEAGGPIVANTFVPVEVAATQAEKSVKLQSLVNALNALQVPAEDVIEIILMLKQKRALSGQLIIQ
jgi:flagellar P-ring protein precursor FlgI